MSHAKIKYQIAGFTPEQIESFFAITDGTSTVITGAAVCNYLKMTFGEYKTLYPLANLWDMFNDMHKDDLLKAVDAYNANYDPLENYNGTEQNIYYDKHGNVTDTTTHGKTTTTTANDVETENSVTTFESTTFRPDTKTKQTGSTTAADTGTTTNVKSHSSEVTMNFDKDIYTADNINAEIKKKHGNLGVTTSQQMITSEWELRKNPVLCMYIDMFVNQYAYYVTDFGGVW